MMIELSDHALRKMEQRHLQKAWVLATLGKPDHVAKSYENRLVAYKKIEKLFLAVVYVKEGANVTVITAHWEKNFTLEKGGINL